MNSIADLVNDLGPMWLIAELDEMGARVQREILVAGYIPDHNLRRRVIRSLVNQWVVEAKARLLDAVMAGEIDRAAAYNAVAAMTASLGDLLDE